MKKTLSFLSALCGIVFSGAVSAADITIYYSPTCPHCHHAREFISNTLVYEYPKLSVREVNVMSGDNISMFHETLKKCEYENGGVPVLVVGEKCFQGYAEFMNDDLRNAVAADLSDADKATAAENKKALESDADAFKKKHADRANAISEYVAPASSDTQKKNDIARPAGSSSIWFYGLLAIMIAALGFVLIGGGNKKK